MTETRREVTGQKPKQQSKPKKKRDAQANAQPPPVDKQAFSIQEFCERHSISVAFYYVLKKLNIGPVENTLLGRKLITREAEAEWRRTDHAALAHTQQQETSQPQETS